MPVYSIHGNHDNPIGLELKGALDLMKDANFLHYFGKITNIVDDVEIEPLTFSQGNVGLAIYGIGWLSDVRLNQLLHDKSKSKLKFVAPESMIEGGEKLSWFKILVLHQNRYKGKALGVPIGYSI
jgi:double-strand break repair protein MRE11